MIVGNISIDEIRDNARNILNTLPTKDNQEAELRQRLRTLIGFIGSTGKKSANRKLGQSLSHLDDYASDIVLYSFYIAQEHPLAKELLFRRDEPVNTSVPTVQGATVNPPIQAPIQAPFIASVMVPLKIPVVVPVVDFDTKVLIKNLSDPREFFIEFTDDPQKRKLKQDEGEFVVYDDSTIGKKIMGHEAGDEYDLNGKKYRILRIFKKG